MNAAGLPDPWESRRLWSLGEMISRYAWQFFLIGELVYRARVNFGVESSFHPPGASAGILQNALAPAGLAAPGSEWLTAGERETTEGTLRAILSCCTEIGLDLTNEIDRLTQYLQGRKRSEIAIHFEHLKYRIADELDAQHFLHVPVDKASYYKKMELFGKEVGEAFPKASEDICSAGSCYALGENTACVFHLMRVMEHCVQRFGTRMKIKLDPRTESWHQIMIHVNNAVTAMPGGKKASRAQNSKKNRFALAAGRLDNVRIVWRNDVMHPKDTYNDEQALEVLTGVKAFVNSVATLL